MNLAAYLRQGLTVIFCPRCQVVRDVFRPVKAFNVGSYDAVTCSHCYSFLESISPADGSAPALAT